jgi:hypothetical protein
MRVTVAQRLDQRRRVRGFDLQLFGEPVRDRGVIGSGACISLLRQLPAQRQRGRAVVGGEFIRQPDNRTLRQPRRHRDGSLPRRIIAGPPMSMFSMQSSSDAFVDSCFERIEIDDQRSIGAMPCSFMLRV